MNTIERTELIDKYLAGTMSEAEKNEFERLLLDPETSLEDRTKLQDEMELQKEIIFAIRRRAFREHVREEIVKINEQARLNRKHRRRRVIFWTTLLAFISAIIVALIILFSHRYVQTTQPQSIHYIFAIDRSCSMWKYDDIVIPALCDFIETLPDSTLVTIIPFAKSPACRTGRNYDYHSYYFRYYLWNFLPWHYNKDFDVLQNIPQKEWFGSTDIFAAQESIINSFYSAGGYFKHVVVFIGDMVHCPEYNIERQFSNQEMELLHAQMQNRYEAGYEATKVYALVLPSSSTQSRGDVFGQLQSVYHDWDVTIERDDVKNDFDVQIPLWFNELKYLMGYTFESSSSNE